MAATEHKNPCLLETYIFHGADVNLRDHLGWSALYFLCHNIRTSLLGNYSSNPDTEYPLAKSLLQFLKILLTNVASTVEGDACGCQCSQAGCLPAALCLEMPSMATR